MMRKLFKGLVVFLFGICCLYILEGACYRLIDGYANWRLQIAWGKPNQPIDNPILKKLPLDHFLIQPTNISMPDHLGYWVGDEDRYAGKIMSFTRPMRDVYEDYIYNSFEPLANFEIRDYEEIQGMVLPGLKKLATIEEVRSRKARRVGDGLEFAKGVLFKIIIEDGTYSYRSEFAELEPSFGFLLENGFACVVLPVSSAEDLLRKVRNFKEKEDLLGNNLFACADGLAATFVMESCHQMPDMWKAIMLIDPDELVSPPKEISLPWTYIVIDEERRVREEGLDSLFDWIKSAREKENLYSSRLSGLLRIGQSFQIDKKIPSYFASYVIYCTKFFDEMHQKSTDMQILSQFRKPIDIEKVEKSLMVPVESEVSKTPDFDLYKIENKISVIEETEEVKSITTSPNFDCEIVRGYRELNAKDAQLRFVSNRDLILKLGLGFEEMGNDVLDQIRKKDPLFHRYYMSLRAIEDSPLN